MCQLQNLAIAGERDARPYHFGKFLLDFAHAVGSRVPRDRVLQLARMSHVEVQRRGEIEDRINKITRI